MFYIAEKQKWDLVIQVALLVLVVACMMVSAQLTANPLVTVAVYGTIYTIKYGIELALSFRFTRDLSRLEQMQQP